MAMRIYLIIISALRMTGVAERNFMTVPALPRVGAGLYSVYEPEISVVDHNRRQVPPLVAVLTEPGRVAILARLLVGLGEDSVFFRPVEVVVLGLDFGHVEMAEAALPGGDVAGLGIEMAEVAGFFSGEKDCFESFMASSMPCSSFGFTSMGWQTKQSNPSFSITFLCASCE